MCFFKKFKIKRIEKKIKALQSNRVHNQASGESISKERALYHELAKIYLSLIGSKKYPFAREMALECFRASASTDDPIAQFQIGNWLLEEAKFRERLQKEGLFASSSNERQVKQRYEEALAYLVAAENLNHILAKRVHGLCYINGYGVEVDKQKGFDLVVKSIDQENAWDKVPQIFAAIGLNKPEFYAALTKHQTK